MKLHSDHPGVRKMHLGEEEVSRSRGQVQGKLEPSGKGRCKFIRQ